MPPFRSLLLVLAVAALGGCSVGEPFVDRNNTAGQYLRKQKLPGYDGKVIVCHAGETPAAEVDRLAGEACAVYGLSAARVVERKWNCRLTMPRATEYACYDPEMRTATGGYVDPFNRSEVERWLREQPKAAPVPPAAEP
jgi:hypothetical protein